MTSSGPGGIQAHIKAIKIMMQEFHRQSQGSSRYTVHGMKGGLLKVYIQLRPDFLSWQKTLADNILPQKLSLKYSQREVWQWVISAMTGNLP